jgi:hypothetical protein
MTRRNLLAPQKDFEREAPRYNRKTGEIWADWKRPLIIPKGGGAPVTYRRVTTYVGVVEDLYNLQRWERRMDALGFADRPDLLLAVAAHRDDKAELNKICERAKEAGMVLDAATTGTALHALTDMIDRGESLPTLPAGAAASLEAFRVATAPLTVKAIEMRTVHDVLQVAGTADRLYAMGKGSKQRLYIGDTKSGNIELGILKIAMQLAVYARSWLYDVDNGAERDTHGADFERGIVMHMPATDDPAEAKCELHWIDIAAGWKETRVARDIWNARKAKFADLTEPFAPEPTPIDIATLIAGCCSADEVRAVYREHRDEWSDDLNQLAAMRAKECDALPGGVARKAG